MRLARIGPVGAERPVVLQDGRAYALDPLTADIDGAFLAGDGIEATRRGLRSGHLAEVPGPSMHDSGRRSHDRAP
ncbi:MAG: hypothetical protein ACRDO7_06125 [Nocardioidaceae bacterium]